MAIAEYGSRGPKTVEQRILWDANRLDSLGVVGLARAFTKGGYEGQTIAQTLKIVRGNMAKPLSTEPGKRVSTHLLQDMEDFLRRLEASLGSAQTGMDLGQKPRK